MDSKRQKLIVIIGCVIVILLTALIGVAKHIYDRDMTAMLRGMHSLNASVTSEQQRRDFILNFRDLIIEINKGVPLVDAYRIAEKAYDMSIRYKLPLIWLPAIGYAESNYNKNAVSPMGARGLYQQLPSTARVIFRMMGIEYSDSVAFNIDVNTEGCALLCDIFRSVYGDDLEMALICYSAGEGFAKLWKMGKAPLPQETAVYIVRINEFVKKYGTRLECNQGIITR